MLGDIDFGGSFMAQGDVQREVGKRGLVESR